MKSTTTKHVLDEKQQLEIINRFKKSTASFDKGMKWTFLGVSFALSTAAIFVVARMEEKNPQESLRMNLNNNNNKGYSKDLEFFRHWFVVIIGLISISYGSLFVKRFNPEKDWPKWLNKKNYFSNNSNLHSFFPKDIFFLSFNYS